MRRSLLLIMATASLLCSCKPTELQDTPVPELLSARIKFGNPPDPTAAGWVAEYANFDMLCFSGNAWSSRPMKTAAKQLREIKPQIKLGEYFHVMAIGQWVFRDVGYGAQPGTWSRDYFDAVTPYLARTNGLDPRTALPDTASIFERNYCINLLEPGAIDALVGFYVAHSSGLDWYMLDFMTVPMPDFRAGQGPRYLAEQTGDMDLDQDGIAHKDDVDEQLALRAAFIELLGALRSQLPDEFLLIPNGALALVDDAVAHLCDGVYVEGFPTWNFRNGAEGAMFDQAAAPSLWSLTTSRYRNGKGLVLIEDKWHTMQLGRVAACFPGVVETVRGDQDVPVLDATRSMRDQLGPALGPVILQENRLTRQFRHGTIVLDLNGDTFRGTTFTDQPGKPVF